MNIIMFVFMLNKKKHFLKSTGYKDIVDTLIGAGADVNAKQEDECTPLHFAARFGNLFKMKILRFSKCFKFHINNYHFPFD